MVNPALRHPCVSIALIQNELLGLDPTRISLLLHLLSYAGRAAACTLPRPSGTYIPLLLGPRAHALHQINAALRRFSVSFGEDTMTKDDEFVFGTWSRCFPDISIRQEGGNGAEPHTSILRSPQHPPHVFPDEVSFECVCIVCSGLLPDLRYLFGAHTLQPRLLYSPAWQVNI
jgi:hypothetical protein